MNILNRLLGRKSIQKQSPTIVHVTHHKAGSQWIYKILAACAPERIVKPYNQLAHFFKDPVIPGKIYPTVYATKAEYDSVAVPPDTRCFVIIRDLRDTLISSYFSGKYSHPLKNKQNISKRAVLSSVGKEEGIDYIMETTLKNQAEVQTSWIKSGHEVLRYEDLLTRDVEILNTTLLEKCGLDISFEHLRNCVEANRFERLSGRKPGQEDIFHHARKGIAGDWRNHFTPDIKEKFKRKYGEVLLISGYEKSYDW